MVDALLSKADKEEELSRIYARAVAAGAGYVTSVPEYDRDGVDLQIRAGGDMRPAIDLQLKATINLEDKGGEHLRYPLPVRNFDLLREDTQTPRLLVVLALPKQGPVAEAHRKEDGLEALRLLGDLAETPEDTQSAHRHRLVEQVESIRCDRLAGSDGAGQNREHPMSARLHDADSLRAVSPAALSAYARLNGWEKSEPYGAHSDVYAAAGLPEIVLPRTQRIGDYAEVAARLVRTFAQTADVDEADLLRELRTADRDAISIRASCDDAVTIDDGLALISGARSMIASTTRSLFEPRAAYQGRPAREVLEYLQRVRLADVAQGSFSVTLLPPAVPPAVDRIMERLPAKGHETGESGPAMQGVEALEDEPIERQATRRLADALGATREAMAETIGGESDAFGNAISKGASANLCQALADMTAPFETLDLSLTWALTPPRTRIRQSDSRSQRRNPASCRRRRAPCANGVSKPMCA